MLNWTATAGLCLGRETVCVQIPNGQRSRERSCVAELARTATVAFRYCEARGLCNNGATCFDASAQQPRSRFRHHRR